MFSTACLRHVAGTSLSHSNSSFSDVTFLMRSNLLSRVLSVSYAVFLMSSVLL